MRKWIILGWAFVIGMEIVSASFNFVFGWRLGENSHTFSAFFHDGWVYGFLSVTSDGFKIVLGVLTMGFLVWRGLHPFVRVGCSALCGVLWLAASVYSLNSAFGSAATNRTDMAGSREVKAENYGAVKSQLAQAKKELGWLDEKYRAAGAVTADMSGMRQGLLWSRTNGCTNATVDDSRSFCQRYAALAAELETSKRAEHLAGQVEHYRKQLEKVDGTTVADPHAAFLAELSSYSEKAIVLAWLLLLVGLVEGGATLGPIVLWMAHRYLKAAETPQGASKEVFPTPIPEETVPPVLEPTQEPETTVKQSPPAHLVVDNTRKPEARVKRSKKNTLRGSVKSWKAERLVQTSLAGGGATLNALYADYEAWCDRRGHQPFTDSWFGRHLSRLGVPCKGTLSGAFRPGWVLRASGVAHARAA